MGLWGGDISFLKTEVYIYFLEGAENTLTGKHQREENAFV